MLQVRGWNTTPKEKNEDLFDLVDNIADLTMDHLKRHLSISESSTGDTAEENSVTDDFYSTVQKKLPPRIAEGTEKYQKAENGDFYATVQKRKPSNTKHGREEVVSRKVENEGRLNIKCNDSEESEEPIYATIHDRRGNLKEESYSDEEDELLAQIEECEDLAMEALDLAAVAVTGMVHGRTEVDEATKAVVEAAKAVAALAAAAEENIEVSAVVKEVQDRLKGLQEIQETLGKQRRPPRGVKLRSKGSPEKVEKRNIFKGSGGRKQKQVRFQEEKEQEERAKLKPKPKVHFLTAWGPDRFYKVFREQEL